MKLVATPLDESNCERSSKGSRTRADDAAAAHDKAAMPAATTIQWRTLFLPYQRMSEPSGAPVTSG
jgi:hypothetical protein